ncbi:MAG TPA: hypothetical protein VFO86_09020 [Terriglobia bacterium]|nr:hypothetical protein [Terriglobia bacterium]
MNHQREAFQKKVQDHVQSNRDRDMEHAGEERHMDETRMKHNEDGSVHVEHADGEKSEHPTMAHAAMHLAAKHHGGEHGHIMPNAGGGATTHHVTMDGQVQGPMDHESEDEAYNHLRGSIGEGSGMDGDESGYASNDEESSYL